MESPSKRMRIDEPSTSPKGKFKRRLIYKTSQTQVFVFNLNGLKYDGLPQKIIGKTYLTKNLEFDKVCYEKEKLIVDKLQEDSIFLKYYIDAAISFKGLYNQLLMEYCPGTLSSFKETYSNRILYVAKQLTRAAVFLHKNLICHSDIKEDNIFVRQNGEVVLGDFSHSFFYNKTCKGIVPAALIRPTSDRLIPDAYYIGSDTNRVMCRASDADLWCIGIVLLWLSNVYVTFDHSLSKTQQIYTSSDRSRLKLPIFEEIQLKISVARQTQPEYIQMMFSSNMHTPQEILDKLVAHESLKEKLYCFEEL